MTNPAENLVTRTAAPAPGRAIVLERRDDGVAVIRIDVPGESVNTLRGAFAPELEAALDVIDQDPSVRAVVVASGKPDGFVAGADIKELMAATSGYKLSELSRRGQAAFSRLAASKKRSSPPSTARVSAAGSSSPSPVTPASRATTKRRGSACPKCSSGSCRRSAARSVCRA